MSNTIEDIGADMAHDAPLTPKISFKPAIPIEEIPEELRSKGMNAADLANLAEILSERLDRNKNVQVTSKKNVTIKDFSKLTQDDVYNFDLPIEAKPFMAGDPLKVVLKDTNYEPRWVNKNSQRLGYMKGLGFTYVVAEDLVGDLEVDIEADAQGHFSFHDVVLMRVPKSTYFPALKAAHIRAKQVVDPKRASMAGAEQANRFMLNAKDDNGSSIGGQFSEEKGRGLIDFYQPNA